ncbi:MAG: CoA-binding protein [Deltaproteobacteria bacterium]|nr:CoA-binding protein [Deltaproteobacteria bacterium]
MEETVAIIGASDKHDRYSYKAFKMLREHGHSVIPIHPRLEIIEGIECAANIDELINSARKVDTVTMYVRSEISQKMADALVKLHPKRVIFNPGAENRDLGERLKSAGIEPLEACTLVLLSTGQF